MPVTPDAYQFLFWLANSSQGFRFRYRSGTPPYESFVQQLHNDVLAHFVVTTIEPHARVGYVVVYSPDFRSGHASYGAILEPGHLAAGYGAEATIACIDYVFAMWPLRKIYTELPEYNAALTLRASSFLVEEAVLRDYHFFDGRYWDQYIYSFSREAWSERSASERATLAPNASSS